MEPFKSNASSIDVVDATENPPPGFEGAGMGKIVQLKNNMSVADVVAAVKQHLGLEHCKQTPMVYA